MPGETKTCPRCAEEVKVEAVACRYCGTDFDRIDEKGRRKTHPAALVALLVAVVVAALVVANISFNRARDDGKRKADDFIECTYAGRDDC